MFVCVCVCVCVHMRLYEHKKTQMYIDEQLYMLKDLRNEQQEGELVAPGKLDQDLLGQW